jgi:Holliday junction DNA helicase RuvB
MAKRPATPVRASQAPDVPGESPRPVDGAPQGDDIRFDRTLRRARSPTTSARRKHKENLASSSKRRDGVASRSTICSCAARPASARRPSRTSWRTRWACSRHHERPRGRAQGGARGAPDDEAAEERHPLHRRDPPPEPRRRGEPLPGARRLSIIDVMTGEGAFASAVQIPLQPFTLVGATTRTGSSPRRCSRASATSSGSTFTRSGRPGSKIVVRSARCSRWAIDPTRPRDRASLARHAAHRQPPPPARSRLRRSPRDGAHRLEGVRDACERLEVDEAGLDEMDRRLLAVVIEHYDGGPSASTPLAAASASHATPWRTSSSRF